MRKDAVKILRFAALAPLATKAGGALDRFGLAALKKKGETTEATH
jgi:hypothetical protein